MKELEAGGDYFSEDEMKRREPLLYEQMIGRFLTEEEQQQQVTEAIDHSDLRFSTILLAHMEDAQQRALYKYQQEEEVRVLPLEQLFFRFVSYALKSSDVLSVRCGKDVYVYMQQISSIFVRILCSFDRFLHCFLPSRILMNKFRSDWGKWMPEGYVQDFTTCSILAESQD